MNKGKVYLIPCPIGDNSPLSVLPKHTLEVIGQLQHFVVENVKTARHFLKACEHPLPIQSLQFDILDKKTDPMLIPEMLEICTQGKNIGIVSEAGCPGVADPGSALVHLAHAKGIQVVPLIGPSSILLAIMAAGFNGQSFAFHGYLPKSGPDLKKRVQQLERISREMNQTQVFIETPFRTQNLIQNLLATCSGKTKLCVAANINQVDEKIISMSVENWKKSKPNFDNVPAVFLLYCFD